MKALMMSNRICLMVCAGLIGLAANAAQGQLILNEFNAVGAETYLDGGDSTKPYEGFDYGVVPHSGSPLNPFPADIDAAPGTQTSLPNGWDLNANPSGFGRIEGNGGDWLELVVTEDFADLRGYTLYWENDDTNSSGNPSPDFLVGSHPEERGFIKLSNDAAWSNLRAGTIITLSEDNYISEVNQDGVNTGHSFDLNTDTSFDPFNDDWHMHFHVDEGLTDNGQATQYFAAYSDIKVDNDRWRMYVFDSTNTAVTAEAEVDGGFISDLATGLVHGPIGESAAGWGSLTGGGNIGSDEVGAAVTDPTAGLPAGWYEDVDFSTFGTENMFNVDEIENTLTGVQDFAALRAWFLNRLPGDANLDGTVNGSDLAILAANFSGTDAVWTIGDFNDDAVVNGTDLAILAANFGASAEVLPIGLSIQEAATLAGIDLQAVPEPASVMMLLGGALLIFRRRAA